MFTRNLKSLIVRLALIPVLLNSIVSSLPNNPVLAATISVTNMNDSGAGSLRQAIANANPGDTITFDSGLSDGTIHLISTLTLSKDVTIDGSALASQITISGDDLYRVFYINSGVTVTLDSLIIARGKSPHGSTGGGIFSAGALTVTNSTISENRADYGGGIFNEGGSLTMIDSALSYNDAYMYGAGVYSQGGTVTLSNNTFFNNIASFVGGGVYNAGGTVLLNNSTFSYNGGDPLMSSYAGGIYNIGTLTIKDSTFSNNSAQSSGGGIFHASGTLTITNSIFSGNSINGYRGAGGGIINDDTLIIAKSTFSGNSAESGGAIYNNGTLGKLTVTDSTFSANSALDGAGIFNYGTLTVTNSTFSSNGTSDSNSYGGGISNYETATVMNSTFSQNFAHTGGGIHNWDTFTVTNSTFSGNEASWGGGIANSGNVVGGTLTVRNSTFSGNGANHGGGIANMLISSQSSKLNYINTVIAGSTSGGDCYNVGVISTNINNLVEDGSCSASMSGDPNLGPLADNGGPTQTMALLPDSQAIDAGNDANCPATDQRGLARPYGSHCDIGAYEAEYILISGNAGATGVTLSYVDGGTPMSFRADSNGNYLVRVPKDWSGTVTPSKAGYIFTPTNRTYSHLQTFQTGQDYTAQYVGGDTTGVFRPSNGLLYLKNKNDTGIADMALNYGLPGDYPVVGDWDGNGTVTIGIYRDGYFYLRNENTIGFAEVIFPFGQAGDQPVAGDWNGDGVDTIGIYRPSNGQFLLRGSNTEGPEDMSFFLGNPGDVGLAGDWDGDGKDTTGVFRPSNGIIFLKSRNETGFADVALNYGLSGDKPMTGDWNNDGIDTIGVYRNGQFMLRNSNTIGFAEIIFGLGNPGDMPIAGNWDALP